MLIPMKKATLIALKEDKENLFLSLQRSGEFMVISPDTEGDEGKGNEQTDLKAQKTDAMLHFMKKYREKGSFFEDRPFVDYETFITDNAKGKVLANKVSAIATRLTAIDAEIGTLKTQIEQLKPWEALDIPLSELKATRSVDFCTGYIPLAILGDIQEVISQTDSELMLLGMAPEGQAAVIISYHDASEALMHTLKTVGFVEATPPRVSGRAADAIVEKTKQIQSHGEESERLQEEMKRLAKDQKDLELLADQYEAEDERNNLRFVETVETIVMQGWVREDRMERVEEAISRVTDVYDLSYSKAEEGEQPPTVTKNSRFIGSFETITDMFSKPEPGTIDPAIIAGLWYWVIFGMMMGDAGYGAVMAIGLFAFRKLKKPKGDFARLINVLYYSSFTTIFWGVMFGSYFGATFHPIMFSPLDNPIGMLIFTMIVGVLHIFSGMGIKMAESIRAGRPLDAVFDQLSWMILIVGLGLMFLPATKMVGTVMAIIGAAIILLTAGRESKNIVGKVTGGLLGLYDITSYMSDILSYSRILALSLATGVVGMVMNLLAGMVATNFIGYFFALLIYLVGHSFNIAMGLLSAYVHDSRLQYIEFFNKFYEGGGYAFTPLSIKSKHIDVIDENK